MATPIDLNNRREPFVDDHVLDSLDGCRLQLHHPTPAGTVLAYDEPWERGENGSASFFTTVFQDGDLYRMYYRANLEYVCYAESADGIHWVKPELGLVEVEGSSQNNIILDNCQNAFCPFLDVKPGVPSEQRYKANMERDSHSGVPSEKGLNFYESSDGTRFRIVADAPVIPWTIPNHFDSQNVMFWSDVESQYVFTDDQRCKDVFCERVRAGRGVVGAGYSRDPSSVSTWHTSVPGPRWPVLAGAP